MLKDLCARLPYGVKCQIDYDNEEYTDLGIERYCDDRIVSVCVETEEIGLYEASAYFYPGEIKPYLRPMSSMSDEEKDEYDRLVMCNASWVVDDWLNKKGFDYRGLIHMGLALEAPEDMYKF